MKTIEYLQEIRDTLYNARKNVSSLTDFLKDTICLSLFTEYVGSQITVSNKRILYQWPVLFTSILTSTFLSSTVRVKPPFSSRSVRRRLWTTGKGKEKENEKWTHVKKYYGRFDNEHTKSQTYLNISVYMLINRGKTRVRLNSISVWSQESW